MDAIEFLLERERMCKQNYDRETECKYCVAYDPFGKRKCKAIMLYDINIKTKADFINAISVVEQWSKEHPRKTRMQDFIEKYPNAPLEDGKTPYVCPHQLGYAKPVNGLGCCLKKDNKCLTDPSVCVSCWNEPVE